MNYYRALFAILMLSGPAIASNVPSPASAQPPTGQVDQLDTKSAPEMAALLGLLVAAQAAQATPPTGAPTSATPSPAPSSAPAYHDMVFVKVKDIEGFQGLYGTVIHADEEQLLFEIDGALRLFDKDSVRAVILDPERRGPTVDHWKRILPTPWTPPVYHDTVFVKIKNAEGFQGLHGNVVNVDEEQLLFETDGALRLFDRGSVRAVILDSKRRGPIVDRWHRILPTLWNSPRPFAIELAQSLPWIGTSLRTLDRLPPFVASLIAILLTLAVLAWIVLRLQESVVDAAAARRLSRLKLELDIAKARYEVLGLAGEKSTREREAVAQIPLPDFRSAVTPHESSDASSAPALRRAIDAIFVHMGSSSRFREDVLARMAEWRVRLARNRGEAIGTFSRRQVLQAIGELLLFLWGPVLFVFTVIILPGVLADKSPTSDPELASALMFALVPDALAALFWIRVRRDRLVSRTAFIQAKNEYDASTDEAS